jgi:hypothetical protein
MVLQVRKVQLAHWVQQEQLVLKEQQDLKVVQAHKEQQVTQETLD